MKEINDLEKYVRKDLPGRFNEIDILKRNWSRVLNIFDGNILPPFEILIHTSSICNLCCKWCIGNYVSSKQNKSNLLPNELHNVESMKKVIDGILSYKKIGKDYETGKLKEFKVENVSFSGITGEPMMSKDSIIYAINKLVDNGIRVGMFTNGTLLTEDIFDSILRMSYVLISIDAGNNDTYCKMKCDNKKSNIFDNLLKNIKLLAKKKKEVNSNLDINIGYVINQYNYNQIYELAIKLKAIGVHYFRLKTDIASIMLMNDAQIKEAKEQIKLVKECCNDNNFELVEIHKLGDEKQKSREISNCYIHYLMGAISADGKVYPCNYHPKPNGYSYDSCVNKSFGDIWDNLMQYNIDTKIPTICPKVCDPFKNRANKLLEVAHDIYKTKGIDYLKKCVKDIENM